MESVNKIFREHLQMLRMYYKILLKNCFRNIFLNLKKKIILFFISFNWYIQPWYNGFNHIDYRKERKILTQF